MSEITLDLPGKRDAGQLITAEDFNKLTVAVATLNEQVVKQIDDLRGELLDEVTRLDGVMAGVAGRVTELEGPVGVLEQQYRVTLETGSLRYALGQVAAITARVTDFEGNPLDMSGGRPWVNFVTAWGQFKSVAGFGTRGGQGDRTISVPVNNQGVARVNLRAESVDGLSDEDDDMLVAFLNTPINFMSATNQTMMPFSEAILMADTPAEIQVNSNAYEFLNNQYQTSANNTFNFFVDNYYLQQPGSVVNWFDSIYQGIWHDYRSTVMAIATADSDPRTPDRGRGYSSIQITFRDWVNPWVNLGWLGTIPEVVPGFMAILDVQIVPDYMGTIVGVQEQVDEVMVDLGILGRLRNYKAFGEAMERIPRGGKPDFTDDLLEYTKDMMHMQQIIEVAQAQTAGATPGIAAKIFGSTAVQQAKQAADAETAIGGILDSMGGIREMAEGVVAEAEERVGASVLAMEGRMTERFGVVEGRLGSHSGLLETHNSSLSLLDGRTEALQQTNGQLLNDVSAVSGKVTVLENFDVIDVQDKLASVVTLQAQLQEATMELGALRELISP